LGEGPSSGEVLRRERRRFVWPFIEGRGYSSREGAWRPFIRKKVSVEEGGGCSSIEGGDCSSREGGDCRRERQPFANVVGRKNNEFPH
jgi:hypothetical protein